MPIENLEPQQLLDYVGHTQAALEKSAAQLQELTTIKRAQAHAESFIPEVVNALIENERIKPTQKQAAEAALKDPAKALQLMLKLAAHRNEKEVAAIGKPAVAEHNKVAAYSPIGASGSQRESDRMLFEAFGVHVSD